MKYNTGLKWVKRENNEIASTLLGVIYLVRKQNLSKSLHFLPRDTNAYISWGKKC